MGNQCSASRQASRWEHFGIKSQSNAHAWSCRARAQPVPLPSLYVPPATPLRTAFQGLLLSCTRRSAAYKACSEGKDPVKMDFKQVMGEASYTLSPDTAPLARKALFRWERPHSAVSYRARIFSYLTKNGRP